MAFKFEIEINGYLIGHTSKVEFETDYAYTKRLTETVSSFPITHRVILGEMDFTMDIRHGAKVYMVITKLGFAEPVLKRPVIANRDFGFKDTELEFYWFEADDGEE